MAPDYTYHPSLQYLHGPLSDFAAARPEFEGFSVSAIIRIGDAVLLLQRAKSDTMSGCWEPPGGACELDGDDTLLDGVWREVNEETGLCVSHFSALVAVDSWNHRSRDGVIKRIARYSFLVEVHEALRPLPDGQLQPIPRDNIRIQLAVAEHQDYDWGTKEVVQKSLLSNKGTYKWTPLLVGQGHNVAWAFEI